VSVEWPAVQKAIGAGDASRVATLLLEADEPGRRALVPDLKRYRQEVERDWHRMIREASPLRVAGVGCLPRAADVVTWLRSSPLLTRGSTQVDDVLQLLAAPGRPSLAAVATGMAERLRPAAIPSEWPFVGALLRAAGLVPPANDAFTRGWIRHLSGQRRTVEALTAEVAADSWTPLLVSRMFDTERAGEELDDVWAAALAALCTAGTLDRGEVLAGCLRRMRAGDRPGAMRGILAIYQELAPGPVEIAAHRQEYLGLLTSPHGTVAGTAQAALFALDDAGELPVDALVEASRAVLPRSEKKLVRAQFTRLDQVARQRPDARPEVVAALAAGLGNEAVDLAERALVLAARHLPGAGEDGRAALLAASAELAGDLRRRAVELLGTEPGQDPPTDGATPALVPLAATTAFTPIGSLGELVAEAHLLLRKDRDDPVLLERVLDGLVRWRRADPDELAGALIPVLIGWADPVTTVLRAGAGQLPVPPPRQAYDYGYGPPPGPVEFIDERLGELAARLLQAPPVALLATPATVDGRVDPGRMLALLRRAEEEGWEPGRYDLAQALLRLPRTVDAELLDGSSRLTSPAGRLVHRWLSRGGLPDPVVRRIVVARPECTHGPGPYYLNYRCWCTERPAARHTVELAPPAHEPLALLDRLLTLPGGAAASRRCYAVAPTLFMGWWPMVLPEHREITAGHALPRLAPIGDDNGTGGFSGGTGVLTRLARCGGPFGPAMALALAYALGARRDSERLPATDAIVWLAGRDELDGELLGRELGALIDADLVVLSRVVRGLREVARAGAQQAVWAIAAQLLPTLLRQATVRPGTPDLLALAAAAAGPAGARTAPAGLAEVAARGGTSRLVTEANRLVRALR